ncbi:MAG: hypothetical protein ACK5M1_10795 [Xanthomarina gelatinilytica]|uniref:hypothetical protein n=1 Tax=Xanthomarina gelatinilytica TaxID=1137281 RepID=UPI003A882D41
MFCFNKGLGKIQLSKSLNTQGQISRDDAAQVLVRSLHEVATNKQTLEIIQGDTLIGETFKDIIILSKSILIKKYAF